MYAKHILAIVCSGVLTVGMVGSVTAKENAAAGSYQTGGSENGLTASKTVPGQTTSDAGDTATSDTMAMGGDTSGDDTVSDDATAQAGTTATEDTTGQAMAQSGQAQPDTGASDSTIMAGKAVRNLQGESLGRISGVVVDEFGRVQAIVIATDEAAGSGQDQQAAMPGDGMQAKADEGEPSVTDLRASVSRMEQQLAMQRLEIGLLRQQLARQRLEQQLAGGQADRLAMGGLDMNDKQVFNAQGDLIGRIDTVVVDRFGEVQAVVLESPAGTSQTGSEQFAAARSDVDAGEQPGQRRRAIIIFQPSEQASGFSAFERRAILGQ